jgi:DNA-binding MarR family transcriptional regulator
VPTETVDVDEVAGALRVSFGLLFRRLKQLPITSDLTMSEISALARLDRYGPATSSDLAKIEQISPQSMSVTVGKLLERSLVARAADPDDGRRVVLSLTDAGRRVLNDRRSQRTERMAAALAEHFDADELAQLYAVSPLIERLAHSV